MSGLNLGTDRTSALLEARGLFIVAWPNVGLFPSDFIDESRRVRAESHRRTVLGHDGS